MDSKKTMDANNPAYYNYTVKTGDNLSGIMHKMYGVVPGDSAYRKSLDFVLQLNPAIKNPTLIYPGQKICLGIVPANVSFQSPLQRPTLQQLAMSPSSLMNRPSTVEKLPVHDDAYYWALSWLEHRSPGLVIPGSIAAGATQNLLSPGNTSMITKVSDLYADYKLGSISKGQYDYRRMASLNELKRNLGPTERILFGGRSSRESVRIARGGGVPATAHINKHAGRLKGIAKMGRYGGIALAGVGVTASCMQIANTSDRKEKNEIFIETLGSSLIGGATGSIVGFFLISNPVGWGTAIVLAAGSVAISYSAGKIARTIYDKYENPIDIVSGIGVDKICR